MKKIKEIADKVYIVAYKEDTRQLEEFFRRQGFSVQVFRRNYTQEELGFSAAIRCLINHRDVWAAIAADGHPGIVVEADFVPIVDFAEACAPFDPDISPAAIGWLYAGGPVLYGFDESGYAIGHSSTAVALLITAPAAPPLVTFANEEIKRSGGKYSLWDTYYSHRLRRVMDVPTYIPFKQFGEHGGIPNPEHQENKTRTWHQGDILLGPLAFMPAYATGSVLRYRLIRVRANIRGLLRIILGRYIEPPSFRNSDQKRMIIKFTLYRWLPWRKTFIAAQPKTIQ